MDLSYHQELGMGTGRLSPFGIPIRIGEPFSQGVLINDDVSAFFGVSSLSLPLSRSVFYRVVF
jgi:hypothetical protein